MTGQPRERFFLLRGGKIYRGSAHVCHTRFRELFCRAIHSFVHRSASMEPESPTRNTYETCFLLSSRTRCRDEKKEGEKKKKESKLISTLSSGKTSFYRPLSESTSTTFQREKLET